MLKMRSLLPSLVIYSCSISSVCRSSGTIRCLLNSRAFETGISTLIPQPGQNLWCLLNPVAHSGQESFSRLSMQIYNHALKVMRLPAPHWRYIRNIIGLPIINQMRRKSFSKIRQKIEEIKIEPSGTFKATLEKEILLPENWQEEESLTPQT